MRREVKTRSSDCCHLYKIVKTSVQILFETQSDLFHVFQLRMDKCYKTEGEESGPDTDTAAIVSYTKDLLLLVKISYS